MEGAGEPGGVNDGTSTDMVIAIVSVVNVLVLGREL
jgi:hypothetical protein